MGQIDYDFNLSMTSIAQLEEIIACMDNQIVSQTKEIASLISEGYKGDTADRLLAKYSNTVDRINRIREELLKEIEEIKSISKRIYILKQENDSLEDGENK